MSQHLTVSVTGAAGQIAYSFLFRLAAGEVFGPNVRLTLKLLEIPPALSALQGVVMELNDCAFPLVDHIIATDQAEVAFADTNWAILIGSAPRKAGMERSDLLGMNGGIFKAQGQALNEHAAEDVRVFVVGNPCNTNCMIAMQHAPRIPNENFYAMTMLDQNRATTQLAQKAGVAVSDVKNAIIWGNHSATQYPDAHHASINGQSATAVLNDNDWLDNTFIPCVQKRGAAIIQARGASSAASAANGIVDGVRALITETPAGEVYSMARVSNQADYGVPNDIIFSFPCKTVNGRCEIVTGYEFDADAQTRFDASLQELKQERDTVAELGLMPTVDA